MINKSTAKTRELTVFQLFEILQEEYIVCELRAKIYPLQKHKDYWINTMKMKKEKILDIARKNSLPCLFDNDNLKRDFTNRVIPEIGYPKFLYKDQHQQLLQEKWDLHNYYIRDAEVTVMDEEGKTHKGTIITVNFNEKKINIKLTTGLVEEFVIDTVTRVL